MDTNGRHCQLCLRIFPAAEVVEITSMALADSMYGRPPTMVQCVDEACPSCGWTDLEPMQLCTRCLSAHAVEGYDYCATCAEAD
jgi:hypothetical protein